MIISNSEVETYLNCQKKHYYAFRKGMKAKNKGRALGFGVLGHRVWEAYYRGIMHGMKPSDAHGEATEALMNALMKEEHEGKFTPEAISMVTGRFAAYVEHYSPEPFKVLGVEDTQMVEIDPDNTFAFTVDLLVEFTKGPFKGEVSPFDFKWTYNFWSDWEKKMHPQFPKYIWGLRQMGMPVQRAFIDQIRYREDAKDLFERYPVNCSEIMLDRIMEEHVMVANEIRALTVLDPLQHDMMTSRRLNRRECKYCDYNSICFLELNGKDPTPTWQANFMPSDYGYRR